MDKLTFAPLIDVPLVVSTVGLFIRHFNGWVRSNAMDANIDLAARLPMARRRVVVLFVAVLLLCWLANLAVWSLFAVLFGLGIAIAVVAGGDVLGGEITLGGAAYLIREWAFGFPEMILEPPDPFTPTHSSHCKDGELLGKSGFATVPIRPTGPAEIENMQVSVSSADGRLIEAGTEITVIAYRNGRPCVSPRS